MYNYEQFFFYFVKTVPLFLLSNFYQHDIYKTTNGGFMKLIGNSFLFVVLSIVFSTSAFAGWSSGGVSCPNSNYPNETNKVTYYSISFLDYSAKQATYEISSGTNPPQIFEDQYLRNGTYATATKINSRTVWVGLFDWIQIYDGMIFEDGNWGPVNGTTQNSRVEVHFLPYNDKAYGPDYAEVTVYVFDEASSSWQINLTYHKCHVSLSH